MEPVVPQDHKPKKRKRKKNKASYTAATQDRYAPTTWGAGGPVLEDLELPSGQIALVRRPGLQGLIEAGVLRDMDTLTKIVAEEHIHRVEGDAGVEEIRIKDKNALMNDEAALLNIMHVVDRVVVHCVVKPEVLMTPNDKTSIRPDKLYTFQCDIEDRMFIFQYACGGTRSVERFRAQSLASMGGMDTVEDVAGLAVDDVQDSRRAGSVELRPSGDDIREGSGVEHREGSETDEESAADGSGSSEDVGSLA